MPLWLRQCFSSRVNSTLAVLSLTGETLIAFIFGFVFCKMKNLRYKKVFTKKSLHFQLDETMHFRLLTRCFSLQPNNEFCKKKRISRKWIFVSLTRSGIDANQDCSVCWKAENSPLPSNINNEERLLSLALWRASFSYKSTLQKMRYYYNSVLEQCTILTKIR